MTDGARTGLLTTGRNTGGGKNDPQCVFTFALSRGAGGVAVTDGRFGTDPCALAGTIAAAIA